MPTPHPKNPDVRLDWFDGHTISIDSTERILDKAVAHRRPWPVRQNVPLARLVTTNGGAEYAAAVDAYTAVIGLVAPDLANHAGKQLDPPLQPAPAISAPVSSRLELI